MSQHNHLNIQFRTMTFDSMVEQKATLPERTRDEFEKWEQVYRTQLSLPKERRNRNKIREAHLWMDRLLQLPKH